MAVGSYGGAISIWACEFESVYALDGDRFAVREHMTDVVVHHMRAEQRVPGGGVQVKHPPIVECVSCRKTKSCCRMRLRT